MKKELFKRQLAIIMSYMPDRQIIKILGQNDRYQIDPQTGVITDMMSQQQNPETGEVFFTRQADIRDVRSLEYNVISEEAPGNMTKRMMELQALLEMQERLPIPPEQIISKMEISATEKERWLEYINQQQQAESQKQEELQQTEISFEDRKIKVDEEKNQIDLILGLGKVNQAAEKDEKSLITKFGQMDAQEQGSVLSFAAQMAQMIANSDDDAGKAEQDVEIEAKKAAQDINIDSKKAAQDLSQTAAKHNQDMKFINEKNKIALKAAEDKQEQALKFAKQKAAQGGENGKGKQSSPKKA